MMQHNRDGGKAIVEHLPAVTHRVARLESGGFGMIRHCGVVPEIYVRCYDY